MANIGEARDGIVNEIGRLLALEAPDEAGVTSPGNRMNSQQRGKLVLQLAEAHAWLVSPAHSHGGGS